MTRRSRGNWPPAPPTCSTCGATLTVTPAGQSGHKPDCKYQQHVEAGQARWREQQAKINADIAERRAAEKAEDATATPATEGPIQGQNRSSTMARITKRTDPIDLDVEGLRELATMLDVAGRSKMKKGDLVSAIGKAQKDLPEPGESTSTVTLLDDFDGVAVGAKVVTVDAIRSKGVPPEATGKVLAIRASGGARPGAQFTVLFDEFGEVKAGARHFINA